MAQEINAGALGQLRAASTADGGTALTTALVTIGLPVGTKYVLVTPRNFATAVVAKLLFNPYLVIIRTTDALATVATDYSANAQDGDVSTTVVLSSQGTAAQSDFLYVGSHQPFRGCNIDVGSANSNASILTVKYWKSDLTWADISATDGTASGGVSLAIDGTVTWTVPADWQATSLIGSGDTTSPPLVQSLDDKDIYWTRWQFSAALDSSVTAREWHALNASTAYAEFLTDQPFEETIKHERGLGGIGCIEALTNAGTANLIVNVSGRERFA